MKQITAYMYMYLWITNHKSPHEITEKSKKWKLKIEKKNPLWNLHWLEPDLQEIEKQKSHLWRHKNRKVTDRADSSWKSLGSTLRLTLSFSSETSPSSFPASSTNSNSLYTKKKLYMYIFQILFLCNRFEQEFYHILTTVYKSTGLYERF